MGLFNWGNNKVNNLIRDLLYGNSSNYDDENAYEKLLEIGRPVAEPLLSALKREKDNEIEYLDALLLPENVGDESMIREGINIFSEEMYIQDLLYLEQEGREIIHDFTLQELIEIGSSNIDLLISEIVDYVESSRGNYKDYENDPSVTCAYSISPEYFAILGKFKGPKVVNQLIKWLGDASLRNWKDIISVLIGIGNQSVMTLMNSLFNSDETMRKRTAIALGKIGDLRAIEPLNNTLQNDCSNDVQFSAVEALEKIGRPAVDSLINSLRNEREIVRKLAIDALGFIGDKRALIPLVNFLQDKDKEVQEKADKALHRICKACNIDYQQIVKESQNKAIKTISEEKLNIKDKPRDPLERIRKLKELLNIGAITEEEFQIKKNKLMKEI